MALIEIKHTRSRLNIIKRDLLKATTIFSCVSMALFISYYVYLILQNLNNILYLFVYSGLIASILSLFFIETLIKENKKLLKNEKRQALEQKRRYKTVVKILKFIAKSVLVGVATFETLTNFDITISNIANICSIVFLGIQVLFEIIVHYVIKQIDYFRLSLELDMENSKLLKTFLKSMYKDQKTEKKAIISQGGKVHTIQEEKMIEKIKLEADKFEQENKKRKTEIRNLVKKPKTTKKKK